jgi:CubicO group peptidase (beta-lactamase class C family)
MTRILLCIFILLTSLPSFAADDLSNELALAESWLAAQRAYDHVPGLSAAIVPRESDALYWVGPDFPFPTREQVREILGGQSTIYAADRYHQYSNLGLSLVGEIVAEQSGQGYTAYVDAHVLGPLGLKDTSTGFPTDQREPRIATGYGYSGRDDALPPMPRYDARVAGNAWLGE